MHQWDVSFSLDFMCQNKPLTSVFVQDVLKFGVLKSELAANVTMDVQAAPVTRRHDIIAHCD